MSKPLKHTPRPWNLRMAAAPQMYDLLHVLVAERGRGDNEWGITEASEAAIEQARILLERLDGR